MFQNKRTNVRCYQGGANLNYFAHYHLNESYNNNGPNISFVAKSFMYNWSN